MSITTSGKLHALALMGATGSGKSDLAMKIARAANTSIICCDSMQLYRGLDIGTAKPTPAERAEVRHALVDCCDLPDVYSAARWAKEARQLIVEANRRGVKPIIVGGTGLYLRALLAGFADIPAVSPEVRSRLEERQKNNGIKSLYQQLQIQDEITAARLKSNDAQRIIRALSVFESTGKTLSDWQKQGRTNRAQVACPVFVLDMPRKQLRRRLADRFQQMIDAGWMEEVGWLARQDVPATHPAMRAVGYRQLLEHLAGEMTLAQAIVKGVTATRRYAKRQVTWFAHQTPESEHGNARALEEKILEAMAR